MSTKLDWRAAQVFVDQVLERAREVEAEAELVVPHSVRKTINPPLRLRVKNGVEK